MSHPVAGIGVANDRWPLVSTTAVFFDVDFTLIYPGPTFNGEGYQHFAARYGLDLEPARFSVAVEAASKELNQKQDDIYQPQLFIDYARCVLREMGAAGPALELCAREIYDEWAACRHFVLYDDVRPTMQALHTAGLRIGLISNTHRCLVSFQSHFKLESYISGAVSSSAHGYMKPHPSIFHEALKLVGVGPSEAVMVGDSINHDIRGAQQVGMQGVLIDRMGNGVAHNDEKIPVIQTLVQLPAVLRDL